VTREARRAGLEAELDLGSLAGRLPAVVETVCFRVVQEALTNVIRHARAEKVSVKLASVGGNVVLTVSDDGVGFDVTAARRLATSQGLLGMEERVALASGELHVGSVAMRGTTVHARIPIAAGVAA
jgi:signal transduction histidine kinase